MGALGRLGEVLAGCARGPSTGADTPAAVDKLIGRQTTAVGAHVAYAVSVEALLTAEAFTAYAALADATGQGNVCCRWGSHGFVLIGAR